MASLLWTKATHISKAFLNLSGTILKQLKDGEEIKCIH